ncbi:MAG TPA: D-mannonate epimerase, partial [Spirochaeta sp.]|nr:D-mannonate epimerase [Spirochaeta sp.]
MLYTSKGGIDASLTEAELTELTQKALSKLGRRKKVLILPPDYSRIASQAGIMAKAAFDHYGDKVKDIMPAIGTHLPMSRDEIARMYPGLPHSLFREHNWRGDVKTLGRVPADFIEKTSGLKLGFDWPAQVNRMLVDGGHDLILSIGQVVPHEVAGMANYNKNIFIGTGGVEAINKSHYLGAAYGLERIMGRSDTPVRRVLNYASEQFTSTLPIIYIQTVVAADENGVLKVRGIFIGDDAECFEKAAQLSRRVNITTLKKRVKRIVVYLPEDKFRSTWIGNKAIYRSRLAIEDGGELFVIAPGIKTFGEDHE